MSQTYKIRINIEEDGLDSVNSNLDDFIKRARDATDVQKGLESSFGSASKTYASSNSDMVRVAKQAQETKMRLANEEIKIMQEVVDQVDVVKPRVRIAPIVIEDNADLVESAEEQMAIDNRIIKSKNMLNELTNDQIKLDAIKSIQEKANSRERLDDLARETAELENKYKIELKQAQIRAIQANSPNSPERRDFAEFQSRLKRQEIATASNFKSIENSRKDIRDKGDAEEDVNLAKRLASRSRMILDFEDAISKESENISDEDLLNKTIAFQNYLKNTEQLALKNSKDTLSNSSETFSQHNERLIQSVANREAKISDISEKETLKRIRAGFNEALKEYDDRLEQQLKLEEDAYLRNELSEEQLQRNLFEIFRKSLLGRNQLFARTLKANNDLALSTYREQLKQGTKTHATNEKIREQENTSRIKRENKVAEAEALNSIKSQNNLRKQAAKVEAEQARRNIRNQRDQARRAEKIYNTLIRTAVDFNRVGFLAFGRGIGLVSSGLGALVVTIGVATLALEQIGDRYQELGNRIRPVVLTSRDLRDSLQGVFDIAAELRVNVDDVTNAFSKFAIVFRRINRSNEEAIDFTRDLTLLFKASGANAVEVASNITQISQALNQGVLRGDEFRAVAERLPRVFDALAEVMMVSTGELQSLANRGLIPAEKAIEGFELAASRLGNNFPTQVATLTEAMVVFGNSVVNVVGAFGDLNIFRDALLGISDALNSVAKSFRGIENPAARIIPDEKNLELYSANLDRIITNLNRVRSGIRGIEPSLFASLPITSLFASTRRDFAEAENFIAAGVTIEDLRLREQQLVLELFAEQRRLNGVTQTRAEFLEEQLKFRQDLTDEQRKELEEKLQIVKAERESNTLLSRRDALFRENLENLRRQFIFTSRSREEAENERQIGIIANELKKDNVELTVEQENALKDVLNITNAIQKIDATIARGGRTQLENEINRFATLNSSEKLLMRYRRTLQEELSIEKDKETSLANQLNDLRTRTDISFRVSRDILNTYREQLEELKEIEETSGSSAKIDMEKRRLTTLIKRLEIETNAVLKEKRGLEESTIKNKEEITRLENLEVSLNNKLVQVERNRSKLNAIEAIQQERSLFSIRQRTTAIQNETKNLGLQGVALAKAQQTQRIAALQTQEINKNLVGISSTLLSSSLERNKADRDNINNVLRNRFNLSKEEFALLQRTGILNKEGLQTYAEENKSQKDIVDSIISKLGLSKEVLRAEQDQSDAIINQAENQEKLNQLDRMKEEQLRVTAQQEQEINSIIQNSLEERIRQNERITNFANQQLLNGQLSLSNHMLVTNELGKQNVELQKQLRQQKLLQNTDPFSFEGVSDLFGASLQNYLDGANNIMSINEQLNQSFSTFINSSIRGVADGFVDALVSGENFADSLRGTLSSALKQLASDLLVLIIRFTLLAAFGGTTKKETSGTAPAGSFTPLSPEQYYGLPPVALPRVPLSPVGLSGASAASPVISNRIINVVDPSLVGNFLSSPEGTNSILNTISDNSDVVRRSISV